MTLLTAEARSSKIKPEMDLGQRAQGDPKIGEPNWPQRHMSGHGTWSRRCLLVEVDRVGSAFASMKTAHFKFSPSSLAKQTGKHCRTPRFFYADRL